MLKSLATVAAVLCGMSVLAAEKPAKQAQRPNILILYADDLGYGDLKCYNPKEGKIPTPNLDALAAGGMRFTDAHSSSGICTPSRYALLTGRYHWRDFHGISESFGASVFKPGQGTIPRMLGKNGYTTACIGKWHLGWNWNAIRRPGKEYEQSIQPDAFDWSRPVPGGPLDQGFQTYFGDDVINFPPYAWIENDRLIKAPDAMMDAGKWKPIKEGAWECRPGPMVSGWDPYQVLPALCQRGMAFIRGQKSSTKPFFLYFSFPSPHAPIVPADAFDGKSGAGPYGDYVVQTDWVCGQLLKALDEAGLSENTIVIFSADNGPEGYAYARDLKYNHWSSNPLRGVKRDIYDGGHRIPLILKWPGVAKPGHVCKALISQVDLMATFASVLQIKLSNQEAEDSFDLMPLLRDEVESVRNSHVHNTFAGKYAVRMGEWTLINAENGYVKKGRPDWEKRHGYPAVEDQKVQLYKIDDDIGQRHNLAADNPGKVKEMQAFLEKIRTQGHSAPRFEAETPER